MKRIKYNPKSSYTKNMVITIGKIRPFINICKVTGQNEYINAEVKYTPKDSLLEIGSYRKRLDIGFTEYVEDIAHIIYDEIFSLINPISLSVKVYLDDEYLSPWNVEVSS
jgi:NADPH-dependent 7-cyano-7-deazaguanine reductase QueF